MSAKEITLEKTNELANGGKTINEEK